jgi:hypothetical protein
MRSTRGMTYERTRTCVDGLKRFVPACPQMGNAAELLPIGVEDDTNAPSAATAIPPRSARGASGS